RPSSFGERAHTSSSPVPSNPAATTEIYTLSLHDALPISGHIVDPGDRALLDGVHDVYEHQEQSQEPAAADAAVHAGEHAHVHHRSEEHTSELQSRFELVCRLLLAKQKEPRSKGKPQHSDA